MMRPIVAKIMITITSSRDKFAIIDFFDLPNVKLRRWKHASISPSILKRFVKAKRKVLNQIYIQQGKNMRFHKVFSF